MCINEKLKESEIMKTKLCGSGSRLHQLGQSSDPATKEIKIRIRNTKHFTYKYKANVISFCVVQTFSRLSTQCFKCIVEDFSKNYYGGGRSMRYNIVFILEGN